MFAPVDAHPSEVSHHRECRNALRVGLTQNYLQNEKTGE